MPSNLYIPETTGGMASAKSAAKKARGVANKGAAGVKKAVGAVTGKVDNVQAYTRRFVCPSAKGKNGTTNVTVYMKKKENGTYEFRTGDNNPLLKQDGKPNPAGVIRCPSQLISAKVSIENPESPDEYSSLIEAATKQKQYKAHLDRIWRIAEAITDSPTPSGEKPTRPRQKLQADGFKRFKFPCKNIFGSNKLFRVTPNKRRCSRYYTVDSSTGEIQHPTKAPIKVVCYRKGNGDHCKSTDIKSCGSKTDETKCPAMMTDEGAKKHNGHCYVEDPPGSGNWVKPGKLDKTRVYSGHCRHSSEDMGVPTCGFGNCHHHEYDSGAWLSTSLDKGVFKTRSGPKIQDRYRRIIYSQAEREYADAATSLTCSTSLTPEERDRYEKQKTRALDILNMDLKDYAEKYGNQPPLYPDEQPGSLKIDGNCFTKSKQVRMTKLLGEIGQTCFRQLPSGNGRWPVFPFKGDKTLKAVTRDGANQDPNDTDEASKECGFFGNCSFVDGDGNWRRMSSSDYQRDDSMTETIWKDWIMQYPDMRDYAMLDGKGKRTNIVKGHCTNPMLRVLGLKEGQSTDSKSKAKITKVEKQADAKKEKEKAKQEKLDKAKGKEKAKGEKANASQDKQSAKKKGNSWFSSSSSSGDTKIKGQLKEAASILIEVLRSSDNSEQFGSIVDRLNKIATGGSVASIRDALPNIAVDVLRLLHHTPRSHVRKQYVKRLIHQFYQMEKTLA
jgi:hypothetical protein